MSGDGVTYVGHATTLIEVDGTRLLTDPVLMARIGHIRRIVPAPAARLRVDAVLISHAHHDHLDLRSLRRLPDDIPVIAPPGSVADRAAMDPAPGDRGRYRGTRLAWGPWTCTPRQPSTTAGVCPSGRRCRAVGYVVEGTSRVAFYGDTDLFDGMGTSPAISTSPCCRSGAGGRVRTGAHGPGAGRPGRRSARPRIVVPIHWGTLAGPRVWWRADPAEPARRFVELVALHAPDVTVRILAPGERLALPGA